MQQLQISLNGYPPGKCVFFVFSPSPQDNRYKMQMEMFRDSRLDMDEHSLVVAEVFEQGHSRIGQNDISAAENRYLQRQFHVLPGQFKALLIGKDSRLKLIAETFVSPREMFLRIEAGYAQETGVF